MQTGNANPVLIVEDDQNTAALVATYLEREGFSTVIAYDGEQALKMERQYQPAFVILDIMLPKIDGWEVCRRLPESPAGTDVSGRCSGSLIVSTPSSPPYRIRRRFPT